MMLDWPNRAAPKPIDTFYNEALRLIIAAGEPLYGPMLNDTSSRKGSNGSWA
jgi:hypothetical protein